MPSLSPKTSAERVSVRVDFSPRLEHTEDEIVSASVFTHAGSMTITEDSRDGKSVTVWVEGGTPGRYSDLVCRIQTKNDRILDEIVSVFCYA